MSASLRDLRQHADGVDVPPADVSALVAAGERRLRRRRLVIGAGSTAVVVALVIGATALTSGTRRPLDPVNDPPTPTPTTTSAVQNPDSVRPLTYAVGATIRYGDRSIDVGRYVEFVDVTDNGVVFVRAGSSRRQPGPAPLWFTDGSAAVQIGTVEGSDIRGFSVSSSVSGSVLVWEEPGSGERGNYVVFDTDSMQVLDRFAPRAAGDQVLSVHDDAVYFGPFDVGCKEVISFPACVRDSTVVQRYDVATGALTPVSGATYDRDRRSRPRTIVGPLFGESDTVIYDRLAFIRHGRTLLADGGEPGAEYEVRLARTGAPIRPRIPPGSTAATRIALAQWLDDDRVVLFAYDGDSGSEVADSGAFFICDVSTGSCRLELRGRPGARYQVPTLN